MNKYEYRREFALDDDELNILGDAGWELIAVDSQGLYIFKRTKKTVRVISQMESVGG